MLMAFSIPDNSSIITLIETIAQELLVRYHDADLCVQYAWWMLEAITGHRRSELLLSSCIDLTPEQKNKMAQWVNQQVKDAIPLAYLIGHVPFCGLTVLVEQPILIPRPETEFFTTQLISLLKNQNTQGLRILDIGTGSGCIGLALAQALPHASIDALDVSSQALALAQKNKILNNVTNIQFIESDLFTALPMHNIYDIIVSNPPYISLQEWENLDESVKKWEDSRALIASHKGLGTLQEIITASKYYVKKEVSLTIPRLLVEVGYNQAESVYRRMHRAGYTTVEIWKDLSEKDRVVVGYKTDEARIHQPRKISPRNSCS